MVTNFLSQIDNWEVAESEMVFMLEASLFLLSNALINFNPIVSHQLVLRAKATPWGISSENYTKAQCLKICHNISSRTCEVWLCVKRSVKDDFCCDPIKPDQETLLPSDLGSSQRNFVEGFSCSKFHCSLNVLVERRALCVNVWVK